MEKIFKVAAIQMDCVLGEVEKNIETAKKYIIEAAENNAKLIVLPEFFTTGYSAVDKDYALAETIPGRTTDELCALAKKYNVHIIGNIIEKSEVDGVLYDTSFLLSDTVIGTYRKVYLWQAEQLRFKNGCEYPVFDLGFAKIGMLICYEAGFPETARILALNGAQIIVYSAAFAKARDYVWDMATKARAVENAVYVVAAGRAGKESEEVEFAAWSRIVNPKGVVMAEAGKDQDAIIYADIDLDTIPAQRNYLPYMRDINIEFLGKSYLAAVDNVIK